MLHPRLLTVLTDDYITGLVWSSDDETDAYGEASVSPELTAHARRDCWTFMQGAGTMLAPLVMSGAVHLSQVGHDFALTRNRHGAGFWDRDELYAGHGDALTALAHAAGEVELYVGDDGLLHIDGDARLLQFT